MSYVKLEARFMSWNTESYHQISLISSILQGNILNLKVFYMKNSLSPISGLSNEEVNDILGLDEYMSTDEKKNMNKMSDLL